MRERRLCRAPSAQRQLFLVPPLSKALAPDNSRPDSPSQLAGYCEAFATAGLTITK
jgi:hypothetical protein